VVLCRNPLLALHLTTSRRAVTIVPHECFCPPADCTLRQRRSSA
jgi:hypothetical protein